MHKRVDFLPIMSKLERRTSEGKKSISGVRKEIAMLSIKELRKLTGLSQDKFSQKYHLSPQTLRRWEQGVTETPEHYLYAMNELFKYEGYFYESTLK